MAIFFLLFISKRSHRDFKIVSICFEVITLKTNRKNATILNNAFCISIIILNHLYLHRMPAIKALFHTLKHILKLYMSNSRSITTFIPVHQIYTLKHVYWIMLDICKLALWIKKSFLKIIWQVWKSKTLQVSL